MQDNWTNVRICFVYLLETQKFTSERKRETKSYSLFLKFGFILKLLFRLIATFFRTLQMQFQLFNEFWEMELTPFKAIRLRL